jgi:phosphatidylglycerophosphate synthase
MPSWVTPDMLTALAFFAAVGIAICFVAAPYWNFAYLTVAFLFFVHWFGDALDGTIARVRKIERPRYGHYIDHLLDSVSISLILGSLTISAITSTAIWLWALAGFLLIMIHTLLISSVLGEFHLSLGLIGPTEARAAGIFLSLLLFFTGNPILIPELDFWTVSVQITLIDLMGIFVGIAMWSLLIWRTAVTARMLDKMDRKRK